MASAYRQFNDLFLNSINTKGDIAIRGSASNPPRLEALPAGTNNFLLVPNSTTSAGLQYISGKVNRTYYVDENFGYAPGTASAEFPIRPFQNLTDALAAASAPAVIYVQPGTYTDTGLILKDGVDWFFSEGTSINTTGTVFSDGGVSVTVHFSGYLDCTTDGTILLSTGGSDIHWYSSQNTTTGTSTMFDITSAVSISLNTVRAISTSSGPILSVAGTNNDVTYNGDVIDASGLIFNVTGTGSLSGYIREVSGGDNALGAIIVNSNNMDVNIEIDTVAFTTTGTQAIRIIDSTLIVPSQLRTQFFFERVTTSGGLLYTQGIAAGITSVLEQPRIALTSQAIQIASTNIVPFEIGGTLTSIVYARMNWSITTNTTYVINCTNDGISHFTGQQTFEAGTGANFVSLTAGTLNSTGFRFGSNEFFLNGTIANVGTSCSAFIEGSSFNVLLNTGVQAIITDGICVIRSNFHNIFGAPNVAPVNIIDVLSSNGGIIYDASLFSFGVDNTVLFNNSNGGQLYIEAFQMNCSANDCVFIESGSALLDIDQINISGNNSTALSVSGNVYITTNYLSCNNNSVALDIGINGVLSGYLGNLITSSGALITSASTNNIRLNFNEWNCNNPTQAISSTANCSMWLSGQIINVGSATEGIIMTDGNLYLNVTSFYGNSNDYMLRLLGNRNHYLNWVQFNANTINNVAIDFADGSIYADFGNSNIGTGSFFSHTSQGTAIVSYNNISVNSGAYGIRFNGTGDAEFNGNSINTGNCTIGMIVGTGTLGGNTVFLNFGVKSFISGTTDNSISVNSPEGGFIFNCSDFTINNMAASGILVTDTNITLNGNIFNFFSGAVTKPPSIDLQGTSSLTTNNLFVTSDGTSVYINCTGNVWYNVSRTISNGVYPNVEVATATPGQLTVGGYMSTTDTRNILVSGGVLPGTFRVLSSTLVAAAGLCIDTGGTAGNVIVCPSISNNNADAALTIIPTGTLFVDAGVA